MTSNNLLRKRTQYSAKCPWTSSLSNNVKVFNEFLFNLDIFQTPFSENRTKGINTWQWDYNATVQHEECCCCDTHFCPQRFSSLEIKISSIESLIFILAFYFGFNDTSVFFVILEILTEKVSNQLLRNVSKSLFFNKK